MKTEAITVAIVVGAFFVGYQLAASSYGEDIANLRADYAARAQALEGKYREREAIAHQSLVEAWEERDRAMQRVDTLHADVDRVRKQSAELRRRLSSAPADSCQPCRVELARCASLLERGAELVGRSTDLAQRIAIDKDTVVSIVH